MVVTRSGATGVCVASHVTEGISVDLVHAPILQMQTEAKTAVD